MDQPYKPKFKIGDLVIRPDKSNAARMDYYTFHQGEIHSAHMKESGWSYGVGQEVYAEDELIKI